MLRRMQKPADIVVFFVVDVGVVVVVIVVDVVFVLVLWFLL